MAPMIVNLDIDFCCASASSAGADPPGAPGQA